MAMRWSSAGGANSGCPVLSFWLDMDFSINSSLGRQAQNYPLGYKPTRFIYQRDLGQRDLGHP
jgi:hypothetical protein